MVLPFDRYIQPNAEFKIVIPTMHLRNQLCLSKH